jgi:hypothetical protein
MYVFGTLATPFIYLLKWVARFFLALSNGCFAVYEALIGASMWLNDLTEAGVWPKDPLDPKE